MGRQEGDLISCDFHNVKTYCSRHIIYPQKSSTIMMGLHRTSSNRLKLTPIQSKGFVAPVATTNA